MRSKTNLVHRGLQEDHVAVALRLLALIFVFISHCVVVNGLFVKLLRFIGHGRQLWQNLALILEELLRIELELIVCSLEDILEVLVLELDELRLKLLLLWRGLDLALIRRGSIDRLVNWRMMRSSSSRLFSAAEVWAGLFWK